MQSGRKAASPSNKDSAKLAKKSSAPARTTRDTTKSSVTGPKERAEPAAKVDESSKRGGGESAKNAKESEKSETKKPSKRSEKGEKVGGAGAAAESKDPPAKDEEAGEGEEADENAPPAATSPEPGDWGRRLLEQIIKDERLEEEDEEVDPHKPKFLKKIAAMETGAILDLRCENFFHFFLSEHEVWEKVRYTGDFLVRQMPLDEKEHDDDKDEYVICVMGREQPINIPINFSSARDFCYINHLSFDTPAGLVQYHYRNSLLLDDKGTRLLTPVTKDAIFINHAQIAFSNKTLPGQPRTPIASIRTGFFTRVPVTVTDYSDYIYEQGRLEDLFKITRLARSNNHPNILKYYGIAMSQAPVYVLTEHCTQGTLGYVVRKQHGGADVGKRENFCYEIAQGMKYLEYRMILHRNIAVDNIHVDSKGTIKIAEFTNAVFGAKIYEKLGQVLPRHLAPEVHQMNIFSFKSDVWAFGVTVWEIFHNGRVPYEEIADNEVLQRVQKGERLKCISDKYPNKLWAVSEQCWHREADTRPTMADIVKQLEHEKRASTGLLDRIYESFALLME